VVREQDADLASGDLRGEEGAVERHLRVVKAETSHGSQAIQSDASYKSSNADGFTVTWTAIQSGSGRVWFWLAFGGASYLSFESEDTGAEFILGAGSQVGGLTGHDPNVPGNSVRGAGSGPRSRTGTTRATRPPSKRPSARPPGACTRRGGTRGTSSGTGGSCRRGSSRACVGA